MIHFIYSIILLILCLGCSAQKSNRDENSNDTIVEDSVPTVDSIPVTSIRAQNFDGTNKDDSARVELSNPYSDVIVLDDLYYIYDADLDSLLLKQSHPEIIIDPHKSHTFWVSLGLDSIWYEKKRTYLFTFPGKCRDNNVIFWGALSNLGYINKLNGVMSLMPDSIILPILVIDDSELDKATSTNVVEESYDRVDTALSQTEDSARI